jgi:hypothetical protein
MPLKIIIFALFLHFQIALALVCHSNLLTFLHYSYVFKFFDCMFDHKWNKNYFYILFDLKEDVEVKELYPLILF